MPADGRFLQLANECLHAAEYRKEMGEITPETIVILHVVVRPSAAPGKKAQGEMPIIIKRNSRRSLLEELSRSTSTYISLRSSVRRSAHSRPGASERLWMRYLLNKTLSFLD